jgi:hypothetical protein
VAGFPRLYDLTADDPDAVTMDCSDAPSTLGGDDPDTSDNRKHDQFSGRI